MTPVCAHTLSFRPLILPDSSVLEVLVPEDCRASGWVSFDGKFRQELHRGDALKVTQSLYPMPTIQRGNYTTDWFDALRSGFMFNERPRQSSKIPEHLR
jgi:NAD+ kinase